jgi:hypothetical protein
MADPMQQQRQMPGGQPQQGSPLADYVRSFLSPQEHPQAKAQRLRQWGYAGGVAPYFVNIVKEFTEGARDARVNRMVMDEVQANRERAEAESNFNVLASDTRLTPFMRQELEKDHARVTAVLAHRELQSAMGSGVKKSGIHGFLDTVLTTMTGGKLPKSGRWLEPSIDPDTGENIWKPSDLNSTIGRWTRMATDPEGQIDFQENKALQALNGMYNLKLEATKPSPAGAPIPAAVNTRELVKEYMDSPAFGEFSKHVGPDAARKFLNERIPLMTAAPGEAIALAASRKMGAHAQMLGGVPVVSGAPVAGGQAVENSPSYLERTEAPPAAGAPGIAGPVPNGEAPAAPAIPVSAEGLPIYQGVGLYPRMSRQYVDAAFPHLKDKWEVRYVYNPTTQQSIELHRNPLDQLLYRPGTEEAIDETRLLNSGWVIGNNAPSPVSQIVSAQVEGEDTPTVGIRVGKEIIPLVSGVPGENRGKRMFGNTWVSPVLGDNGTGVNVSTPNAVGKTPFRVSRPGSSFQGISTKVGIETAYGREVLAINKWRASEKAKINRDWMQEDKRKKALQEIDREHTEGMGVINRQKEKAESILNQAQGASPKAAATRTGRTPPPVDPAKVTDVDVAASLIFRQKPTAKK